MSFYVKLRDSESYTLIEFQGSVDCALPKVSGLRLGLLDFKDGRISMTIGNHILSGKLTKLEKPFVILEKCDLFSSDAHMPTPSGLPQKYTIKGIVHHKIIFSTRPHVVQHDKMEGVLQKT